MLILPSIIPKNKEILEEQIRLVKPFAPLVQVDICDGKFTPQKTWPYNGVDEDYFQKLVSEEEGWPEWEDVDIELHLMVSKPEEVMEKWISTGVEGVVVHVEATQNLGVIITACRAKGVSIGIAIKPSTPTYVLEHFADKVDFIQCMGSDILGRHGVPLDDRVLPRISELHRRWPDCILSVDIGVTEETAPEFAEAGATKLIVGAAILDISNPAEAYHRLQNLDF